MKIPHGKSRRSAASVFAVALLFSCVIPAASATTLLRMSLAEMAQVSPLIVRARCVGNSTGWDGGEIWTFTTFEVREFWRGSAGRRSVSGQIIVRLLGGSAGNLTSHVSGVPRFRPDEDVVLFLEPAAANDYSIVSWEQGTFRIGRDVRTGDETITQDSAAFATFNPATRTFAATGIRNRALTAFRSDVNAALTQKPRKAP
jgi:hypothetical protein